MGLMLTSPAFTDGSAIPAKYTCEGEEVNPPFRINNLPESTVSLALIMYDPDAPGKDWIHWVLFNVEPMNSIDEDSVPSGATQGQNSSHHSNYQGPCPPKGEKHRYVFHLYALDTKLDLGSAAFRQDVLEAIEGHVIEKAELTAFFQKS